MKIKDGFLLRQIGGENVVLPTASELNLNGMITLNDTGCFLWQQLQQQTDRESLVNALLGEYDVDRQTAEASVDAFVEKLEKHGFLV